MRMDAIPQSERIQATEVRWAVCTDPTVLNVTSPSYIRTAHIFSFPSSAARRHRRDRHRKGTIKH